VKPCLIEHEARNVGSVGGGKWWKARLLARSGVLYVGELRMLDLGARIVGQVVGEKGKCQMWGMSGWQPGNCIGGKGPVQ